MAGCKRNNVSISRRLYFGKHKCRNLYFLQKNNIIRLQNNSMHFVVVGHLFLAEHSTTFYDVFIFFSLNLIFSNYILLMLGERYKYTTSINFTELLHTYQTRPRLKAISILDQAPRGV